MDCVGAAHAGTDPDAGGICWLQGAGVTGAAVAAGAAFLPSFILMLAILPVLERVRRLTWTRAVLRGMGPAVVGILAVSLFRLAPHALPDLFAVAILAASLVAVI